MNVVFWSIVLSLVSALCYAAGAAVMVHRRWVGAGLTTAGAGFHLVALSIGSLTLIQPLGVLSLVFALPLGARMTGRPITRTAWRGAARTVAGLTVLSVLVLTGPGGGSLHADPLGSGGLVEAALCLAVPVVLCWGISQRTRERGIWLGAASGVAFAASSILAQDFATAAGFSGGVSTAGARDMTEILLSGALVAVFSVGGLALQAVALSDGFGGPLATLSVVNPVTAVLFDMTVLGRDLGAGPLGPGLAVLGGAVAAAGVALLAGQEHLADAVIAPTSVGAMPELGSTTTLLPSEPPGTASPALTAPRRLPGRRARRPFTGRGHESPTRVALARRRPGRRCAARR